MANREACEVYIEQEIREGLEQGKKPYSIGKELSAWVEKLFEVNIKPSMIETRARRIRDDIFTSNDTKESNTETNTASYKSDEASITHPPTDRGGAREGAGRPQKEWTEAMGIASFIICHLERIRDDDPKRDEAIRKILNWCNKNIRGGK